MAVNMGSAIAYLELDTSKFTKGFTSAYNDLKVFGDKTATAEQKLSGLSSAFKTAGGVLSKNVTLPLVGVGAASLKASTDFEAGMSEVKAISGATQKEFEDLRNKAIEMGAKTKFSASESADAFKYMAMAGWDAQSMMSGISGIMDLAAASGEDLATTSDIVTDALTAFGLQAKDSAHFADVLAQASSKSNTNVGLMGETFKYVAPVAGALGYTIEDTAVAIGLMANSGIKGSQAGTALRSTLTRLVKPTDAVAVAMERYNISLTDSEGNMKPLSQVMGELRNRFSELTNEEKASLAATLAGQEGMSGLLAIVNASDEDFKTLTDEINNSKDAAKDMAEIMMDNTKGAIEQLKGSLESAGIIIGDRLAPYIRSLAEWITGLVEKFNSLDEETQNNIVKFGLFLAAIGPVMLILSKLFSVVSTGVRIFKTLKSGINLARNSFTLLNAGITSLPKSLASLGKAFGLLTNPITLIITIVVALIGVFVYLWNTNEEFKNKVIEIWETIKESISNVVQGIITFFTETIPTAFNTFVSETLPNIINAIVTWFEQLHYRIGFAIGQIVGYIVNMGVSIWEWITIELPLIIEGIVQWFAQLPSRIGEWLQNVISKVIAWGSDLISKGKQTAQEFVQNFVSFMRELPSKVKNIIDEIPNKIKSVGSKLKQAGKDIFNKLLDGIKSVASEITDFVQGIADTIGNIISGIIDGFNSVVSGADKARSAARSVDGKHANGLDYVPYNGYIAELHEGERVLTKQQNRDYNRGRTGQGGDTFNFYNTKPTPYEYARQMKKAKRELLYDF